ncbi:hypothetical protein SAY86_027618 [Trapa natans]|uniref:Uncharacterized protein n=1 Tax=Trapa natans TaxID=22666 RepID=A0AAN7KHU5_TRANT|nr:hypothetical protein SAY86_027618 [Trapa natans]
MERNPRRTSPTPMELLLPRIPERVRRRSSTVRESVHVAIAVAVPPGDGSERGDVLSDGGSRRSGFIDDKELQRSLSSYSQAFSMRTVHLLMYNFTNTNTRKIGSKEFT